MPELAFASKTAKSMFVECLGTKMSVGDQDDQKLEDQLNEVVIALVKVALEVARPRRLDDEEHERVRLERGRQHRVFEERRERFESAFRAWKEYEERRAFVDLLETALAQQDAANDATREFVAWTRRYIAASEPLSEFFDSFAKNERAEYRHFTTESRRW